MKSREDGGMWMQNVFCVNHAAAESIAFPHSISFWKNENNGLAISFQPVREEEDKG